MPQLRWDSGLETGIEEIDWEHRRLLNIANRLLQARAKGRGQAAAPPVLRDLERHAAEHFEHEERYMREMGFPDLEAHAAEHRRMAKRLEAFIAALASDTPPGVDELCDLMREWLLGHILELDKVYAAFCRAKAKEDARTRA